MNYLGTGNGMVVIAFLLILPIGVALVLQPVNEMWIGVLGLVLVLYTTGVAFISYGESTSKQQENHREVMLRLDSLEEQIHKRLNEQQDTHSTIVPTLQAVSQLYIDYLTKQKGEREQQNDRNDEESSKEARNETDRTS